MNATPTEARRGMWVEGPAWGKGEEPAAVAPPVKKPPWERRYIPVYFWVGGMAAGAWTVATLEDLLGERDPATIRVGRYVAAGGAAASSALLVLDLGRPERFLHMLRLVRPSSTMSVGSWGLSAFGGITGIAALLQAAEDGLLGDRPRLRRLSRGAAARALHLAGLPFALFIGSYTATLLATTSVPAWADRRRLLPALFSASALSSGAAAVSAVRLASGSGDVGAKARLARVESAALAAELALAALDRRRAQRLPSAHSEPEAMRLGRAAALGLGVAAPLALSLGARSGRAGFGRSLLAAGLTIGGALALRLLVSEEGKRSADTPEDTWRFAS